MKADKIITVIIALSLTACSAEPRRFFTEEHSNYIDKQTKESTTDDTDNSESGITSVTNLSEGLDASNSSEDTSAANSSGDLSTSNISENSSSSKPTENVQTGLIREQILNGAEGEIHYSYYLPESYDGTRKFPMMVTMPGYDRMWFGEDSSGSNIEWNGFRAWTQLDEDMIVISAQLTDWHEKSARQANELAQYFIDNFAVDTDRIYAAGYSAGGETMSQADIYMAENDEYYGSQKARDAYDGLYNAYRDRGFSDEETDKKIHLEIPDDEYFNSRGIYNYHGGGNIVFDDKNVLDWIISHMKRE